MNDKALDKMMAEAGLSVPSIDEANGFEAGVLAEREACAKLAEQQANSYRNRRPFMAGVDDNLEVGARGVAHAIRQRPK